jgi:hypothetical protein
LWMTSASRWPWYLWQTVLLWPESSERRGTSIQIRTNNWRLLSTWVLNNLNKIINGDCKLPT